MARWRPPKPRSSPYITAQGRQVLDSELKALWL
jgi:transcription elongation factor GreB